MGKSRGLRRVSFSSSGAIRTTCLFALPRLLETTRREPNVGIGSILQRTRWHECPEAAADEEEEEEEEEEEGAEDAAVDG
jgi:hypothetical protein